MKSAIDWVTANWWTNALIPVAVFLAVLIACLWLRRQAYHRLDLWAKRTRWGGDEILLRATHMPSIIWSVMAGIYFAVAVSALPAASKAPAGQVLGSLFVLSISLCVLNIVNRLSQFYRAKWNLPQKTASIASNLAGAVVLGAAVLTTLDIWGVPMLGMVLLLAAIGVLALTIFKDALTNLFAGLQLNARNHIGIGDYIKLESGEEGTITEFGWRHIQIQALEGGVLIVPNSRLIRSVVINYGHPLKKAKVPFCFYNRVHITELTGYRARNLHQLASTLRRVPDSVVYYHTHHFLEAHHYLVPEPANDFAIWVGDALGEEELSERLAAIDTFEFSSLTTLKNRIVDTIEECLSRGMDGRQAPDGREFHFLKSVTVGLPTPYSAHDLREFVEALRKVSLGSLYYHVFESRMRLGQGMNDFSVWLRDSLGEADLADRVAGFNPYMHTLEGLRSSLIQLVEKRIK
ncbi:MAG: mechanosensitive ion channel family protein [Chloroflexi bacterium]|nr:mechanosensitive ion channel family protein [Chloroflexota bacterium]